MKRSSLHTAAVMVFASLSFAAQAQTLGWPEATEVLAREKSKAQACVDLIKSVADAKVLAEVKPVYADAKATSDGVIAGLTVVLAKRAEPADLPHVRDSLEKAGVGLQKLWPTPPPRPRENRQGYKGPIDKIVTDLIGPIIEALKSAVGGILELLGRDQKDRAGDDPRPIARRQMAGVLSVAPPPLPCRIKMGPGRVTITQVGTSATGRLLPVGG